jgi:cytochrome c
MGHVPETGLQIRAFRDRLLPDEPAGRLPSRHIIALRAQDRRTNAMFHARIAMAFSLVLLASAGRHAQAADPTAGAAVFKSQCSICHAVQPGKNMVGPSLFGVVGRASGSVEGFHYSAANKAAGLTWDDATLDKYLTAPGVVVPGTLMTYAGLKDDTRRADVIAYLDTLH